MAIMRLRPPGVNVYQIFETEAVTIFNATLTPCLVGTAQQIRTDKSSGVYLGENVEIALPELLLTSVVREASIAVKIDAIDGTHEVAKATVLVQGVNGITASNATHFSDSDVDFVATNVAAGDVLAVANNGNFVMVKVVTITDSMNLILSAGLPASQTGLDYFIFSKGGFLPMDRSVLISHTILHSGPILLSYIADRTDHTQDFMSVSSTNDLASFFADEDLVPTNPLAYAFVIALANGVPGLTIKGLVVEQDTLSEHNVALAYLGLKDTPWALVPLTQHHEILQAYRQHALTVSEPMEKKERVVFISHDLITKDVMLLRAGTDTLDKSLNGLTSAGTDIFTDASVDFVASAVQIGDFVNILSGPLMGAYPIDNVTDATHLSLTINIASTIANVEYEIVTNFFDRSEIVTNVQERSMSYGTRRVCAIWPHEVDVPDSGASLLSGTSSGSGIKTVPSYYIGAGYAALAASLPPQTPFSRMPVAGFLSTRYSNDYFTDEELDMMAAGGTWIMVQNGTGANLECRHQLTTDTTTIERREWNITKDIDYIAKTWRATLTPLTGRNLLTDKFLGVLGMYAQSLLDSAIKGGQLLPDSTLTSISRNASASDTVDFRFKLNPPRPANTFNLYLVI